MNSRKGFRTITVDGTVYRWRTGGGGPGRPGYPGPPTLSFIVTPSDLRGTSLIVEFPGILVPNCSCPACNSNAGIALPSHVARAIREARTAGWEPEAKGGTFRLQVSHEAYKVPNPIW